MVVTPLKAPELILATPSVTVVPVIVAALTPVNPLTVLGKPIVAVSVAPTVTSISFAVPDIVSVSPPATVCVLEPSLNVNDVLIEAVDAAVIRPCASTVRTGIAVALP